MIINYAQKFYNPLKVHAFITLQMCGNVCLPKSLKHDEYVYLEIVPFQFSYLLCTEIMAIVHWKGLVTTFSDVAT